MHRVVASPSIMVRLLIQAFRQWIEKIDLGAGRLAVATRFSTALYYLLLNPRFFREQRAVLAGRVRFARAGRTASDPTLRRNIHRLEKGLIMRPRAAVFATDYIGETVDVYCRLSRLETADSEEIRWAEDVLEKYFAVVGNADAVNSARARFAVAQDAKRDSTTPKRIPRPHSQIVRTNIGYDEFLLLCRQRRSVRWFLDRPVARELIDHAVTAAAEAPSACNRQPFFFRWVGTRAEASRIAGIALGTAGYAEQIPSLIVILADLSCFPHERDRHVPYIDGSLAAMQLMLALETLGLGSCPINWPDIESLERRMDEALQLPMHIRPIMLLAVGHPDPQGGVAYSAKKASGSLLRDRNDYPH